MFCILNVERNSMKRNIARKQKLDLLIPKAIVLKTLNIKSYKYDFFNIWYSIRLCFKFYHEHIFEIMIIAIE